jgi:universal stress protein E
MKQPHFLVAVDLEPHRDALLQRAFGLAQLHGARLTVLQVVAPLESTDLQGIKKAVRRRLEDSATGSATESIEAAVRSCRPAGIESQVHVDVGSPSSLVVDHAERLGVDLVIIGAHQGQSMRDKVFGSTADSIVRTSSRPVLVVKRPPAGPYRNVIVATDFSEVSEASAEQAAGLCPGAQLQLVHVAQVPLQFEQALLRIGNGPSVAAYRRTLIARARQRLADMATRFDGKGVELRTRVLEGSPAKRLVRLTWNRDIDLVSIGSRDHGIVLRTLLGSVAQHLLREAACDVLVTRMPSDSS